MQTGSDVILQEVLHKAWECLNTLVSGVLELL